MSDVGDIRLIEHAGFVVCRTGLLVRRPIVRCVVC